MIRSAESGCRTEIWATQGKAGGRPIDLHLVHVTGPGDTGHRRVATGLYTEPERKAESGEPKAVQRPFLRLTRSEAEQLLDSLLACGLTGSLGIVLILEPLGRFRGTIAGIADLLARVLRSWKHRR